MNQNYPYMNPYNFNPYQQRYVPPVQTGIAGKIVQSVEQVVANDVPMDGSIAVFPKQDLSEIYAKQWGADGTIKTVVFRPATVDASAVLEHNDIANYGAIITRLDELSKKIDMISGKSEVGKDD